MVERLQEELLPGLLQQLRLLQQLLMEEVHFVLCQKCCKYCCLQDNTHCEFKSTNLSSIGTGICAYAAAGKSTPHDMLQL